MGSASRVRYGGQRGFGWREDGLQGKPPRRGEQKLRWEVRARGAAAVRRNGEADAVACSVPR